MDGRVLTWATCLLCLVGVSSATASGPGLREPRPALEAGLVCPVDPTDAERTPLMFVTGTGASGDLAWLLVGDAFIALGHPVCYVNVPDDTTADIQRSVEYLVDGIRREYALAGRRVAVLGISQGGLLPRFALTFWPDLRRKVSDVVAVAGTQHGTTVGRCEEGESCAPANWQQQAGSKLLRAINSQPDETPGRTSYTTVRSLTDETVQPTEGPRPSSALEGARNIAIQDVCPGRETAHIAAIADSVTWAAFLDAIAHPGREKRGAARPARFPGDVCSRPYGPGLNEVKTSLFLGVADAAVGGGSGGVSEEPPVRPAFERRRAPIGGAMPEEGLEPPTRGL